MFKHIIILLLVLFPSILFAQQGIRVINNKGTISYIDTSKWYRVGGNLFNKNISGNVAVGLDTFHIPSARLVINNGGSITLPAFKLQYPFSGATTDSVLTWNSADSTVRKISASLFKTLGGNGISNGISGDSVILGGTLYKPTTVTTTSVNTLALAGLQSGLSTDSLVTIDPTSGVLKRVSSNSLAWLTAGNTGTNPATNFLGTIDLKPLVVKTNNVERMHITEGGYVGIDTIPVSSATTPKLNVKGTVNATNYTSPVQTFTTGTTTWDLSNGANAKWTLIPGVNNLTLSNMKAGMYGTIIVTNTGTSTINFTAGSLTNKVINGGGGVVTLTPVAGAVDVLSFMYDGSTFWWTVGNNYN